MGCEDAYPDLNPDWAGMIEKSPDDFTNGFVLRMLKSSRHSPRSNAICEGAIGATRTERVDWLIPRSKGCLRMISTSWADHYHRGRSHMTWQPSASNPHSRSPRPRGLPESRRPVSAAFSVRVRSMWGGGRHEFSLQPALE